MDEYILLTVYTKSDVGGGAFDGTLVGVLSLSVSSERSCIGYLSGRVKRRETV